MKATLTFDLPGDLEEFENAQKGSHYNAILSELDEFMRRKLKYENLTDEQSKAYEEIRSYLRELHYD